MRYLPLLICSLLLTLQATAQSLISRQLVVKEGTNMATALSPDGKHIALDLQGTIYLIPATGGKAQPLTDGMGDDRQPHWTPDGKRIVFQSYRGGAYHIWSVGIDGKDLKKHTTGPYDHREPFVSPDGKSIVCSSDRNGNYDIWKYSIGSGEMVAITSDVDNDYCPAFASNSKTITFASTRSEGAGIYLVSESGTEKLVAATGTGVPNAPSWSENDEFITYQVVDGSTTSLMKVHVNSGKIERISQPDDDVFPFRSSWISADEMLYSSDGIIKKVSFTTKEFSEIPFEVELTVSTPKYDRKTYDFDSDERKPVKGIRCPVVSPDGKQVAFVALGDLWLLTIGNPTPVKLTNDPFYETDPTWSPDGKKLLFSCDKTGNMDLYTLELVSKRIVQLTNTEEDEIQGSWLGTGTKVAFQKQGLRNTLGKGTMLQILDLTTGETKQVYKPLFLPGQPTWSPNGKYLMMSALDAYSSKYREGISKFLTINTETGESVSNTTPTPHQTLAMRYRNGPMWSPDGTKLVYVKDALLWVIDVDENGQFIGQPRALTKELAESPTWTGDSKSVVYLATDHLRVVNVADSSKKDIPLTLSWTNAPSIEKVVIHAGRLFDGITNKTDTNVDIVIEGNRIKSITPHKNTYSADYKIIDASDLTVMPGLFDTHSHLDSQFGEKTGRIWLAYGITGVREPGSDPYDAVEQREAWHSGKRPGPFHFLTGALTDGGRIYYNMATSISSIDQLDLELNRAKVLGYDLIKTYVRLPDEWQKIITEFAHKNGMAVSSHEIFPAARYGVDAVEHVGATSRRGYSPKLTLTGKSYEDMIQIVSQSKMTITPTLALFGGFWTLIAKDTSIFDTPQFRNIYPAYYREQLIKTADQMRISPPSRFNNYKNIQNTVKELSLNGANITSGTDSPIMPYGTSLHVEIWSYVESGLTPFEALQTSTINAAKSLNVAKDLGSIEVGKIANISIVEGNPLDNIYDTQRVKYVLVNGNVYSIEELMTPPGK
jgi:Tol biopolymer transport system component